MMLGMGFTIPITCPTGQTPSPINAYACPPTGVACGPDTDPSYGLVSNWVCKTTQELSSEAGFTYSAGLQLWTSPATLPASLLNAVAAFPAAPSFTLGALTPILAVVVAVIAGHK